MLHLILQMQPYDLYRVPQRGLELSVVTAPVLALRHPILHLRIVLLMAVELILRIYCLLLLHLQQMSH